MWVEGGGRDGEGSIGCAGKGWGVVWWDGFGWNWTLLRRELGFAVMGVAR